METDLAALLKKNGIHADIISYMTSAGCTSICTFTNWCDSRSALDEAFARHIASTKQDVSQAAKMRQAWREAEAQVSRSLKRMSDGMSTDEPLQPELRQSLSRQFCSTYSWPRIDPRRMGAEAGVRRSAAIAD